MFIQINAFDFNILKSSIDLCFMENQTPIRNNLVQDFTPFEVDYVSKNSCDLFWRLKC